MRLAICAVLGTIIAVAVAAAHAGAPPAEFFDPLRGRAAVDQTTRPPLLQGAENRDLRRTRSYAMQPPTIPHSIDNYQIDRYANRCLMCHGRNQAAENQAPPVSITHYTDRNGNFLADVAPRRYFCDTCHVVQMDVRTPVGNSFEDAETLARRSQLRARSAPQKK